MPSFCFSLFFLLLRCGILQLLQSFLFLLCTPAPTVHTYLLQSIENKHSCGFSFELDMYLLYRGEAKGQSGCACGVYGAEQGKRCESLCIKGGSGVVRWKSHGYLRDHELDARGSWFFESGFLIAANARYKSCLNSLPEDISVMCLMVTFGFYSTTV